MPYLSTDGDFERIFMTSTEFVDQFVGSSAWSWGSDSYGSLGNGSTNVDTSSPGTVSGNFVKWKQLSSGYRNSGGVQTDGTLWMWGEYTGDGTTSSRTSPVTTAGGGTNWKQVSCGLQSTTAIKTDGTLWSWGSNSTGRLGDGTTSDRLSPITTAGGGTNWKQVSVGWGFAAAVKTDGTLWTWGGNSTGQLGDGTTTSRSSPGTALGALVTTVYDTSNFQAPMTINTGGGTPAFIANTPFSGVGGSMRSNGGYLYTSPSSNYILDGDFTLEYWFYSTDTGGTYNNQFNIGTMSGGSGNGIGVRLNSSDSVYLNGVPWGYLTDLLTYAPVSTWNHLAISRTGTIIKIFVNGTQRSSFTFTATLNSTGAAIYLFTSPDDGRNFPGYLSNFRLIKGTGLYTSSFTPSTVPLTAVPNTVFLFTGTPVYNTVGWKQVSCGNENHMAAIKTDGTLWTWGNGANGQLGNNLSSNYSSPITTAGGGTNWKQVSSGYRATYAIKTDGTLWSCGYNQNGALGQNVGGERPAGYASPQTIAGGGTNWKSVAGSLDNPGFAAAVKTDGTLWSWGGNSTGQLGDGTTTSRSSPTQVLTTNVNNWKQVSCGYRRIVAAAQN